MVRLISLALIGITPLVSAISLTGGIQDQVRTAVAIDTPTAHQTLDNGELLVHITRTEDLFSDNSDVANSAAQGETNEHRLLLERVSHIMLKVRLDKDNGRLDVNGNGLDLVENEELTKRVMVIKAETLAVPTTALTDLSNSDLSLENLKSYLSPGIVSAQIIVESELTSGAAISSSPLLNDDGEAIGSRLEVSPATQRKVNVWIKLIDIDGHHIPHLTTLHTNILQFLISTSPDTNKLISFKTLSITPSSPTTPTPFDALNLPGPILPSAVAAPPLCLWSKLKNAFHRPRLGCHSRPSYRTGLAAANNRLPGFGLRPEVGSAVRDAMSPHQLHSEEDIVANEKGTKLVTHRVGMPGVSRTGRWADRQRGGEEKREWIKVVGAVILTIGGMFIAVALGLIMVPLALITNPVTAVLLVAVFVVVRRRKLRERREREEVVVVEEEEQLPKYEA